MGKNSGNGRKGQNRGTGKKKAEQSRGDGLSPQMLAFCEAYVLNMHNGADAYLKAYPASAKHASQYRAEKASKLLAQAKIQAKVAELEVKLGAKLSERFDITADGVLQEIAALAMANPGDYYEWGYEEEEIFNRKGEPVVVLDAFGNNVTKKRVVPFVRFKASKDLTAVQKKAIAAVGLTYSQSGKRILELKLTSKHAALKDLAAFLKLNTVPVELTGKNGGPIESVHHVLPDLEGASDPKAILRAFEDFRSGNGQGTRH